MTKEAELKPCPFCGGKADFNNDGERWHQVICGSCGCRGCEHPDDKAKAAASWNHRPSPELGLRQAIDGALRTYFKSLGHNVVSLSSDGIERIYYSGFSLSDLTDAVLTAVPDDRANLMPVYGSIPLD